jgi:hypothetical protein
MSGQVGIGSDETTEIAEEVSKRMRIVPWRRFDRWLFVSIAVVAVADLVVNVLIFVRI